MNFFKRDCTFFFTMLKKNYLQSIAHFDIYLILPHRGKYSFQRV